MLWLIYGLYIRIKDTDGAWKFVLKRLERKEGESLYKHLSTGLGRRDNLGYAMGKTSVC